jgi:hypothetical protein
MNLQDQLQDVETLILEGRSRLRDALVYGQDPQATFRYQNMARKKLEEARQKLFSALAELESEMLK